MTTRVYHPTLNAWHDVADDARDAWKEAGWRLTKPEQVDDSAAPSVGEHSGYPDVPREAFEVASPDDVTSTEASTKK